MIDYTILAYPKARARVLDRIEKKQALAKQERACRLAVKARDKGRCVVPGCKDAAKHLHHLVYRSQGGKWTSDNVCSLCVLHHQFVHAGLLSIDGHADRRLTFRGQAKYLKETACAI